MKYISYLNLQALEMKNKSNGFVFCVQLNCINIAFSEVNMNLNRFQGISARQDMPWIL